jgi:tetratricopeptide (TPR) repeat protein
MAAVMPRILILAVVLAAGLPAVAQEPAPPPSSTSTQSEEQKSTDSAAAPEEKTEAATDPNAASEAQKEEQKKKKGALGRLKDHVKDHFSTGCVGAGTVGGCWGDEKDKKDQKQEPAAEKNPAPPRSSENTDPEFSSSRDTQIDLNPPGQERPVRKPARKDDDVQELQHYDPHAAEKDIEVGEYYLKTGNVKAALARFRSALYNKPNDATATFRLAQALEKAKQLAEARENYARYLKVLPKGEFAAECQKALERIPAPAESAAMAPGPSVKAGGSDSSGLPAEEEPADRRKRTKGWCQRGFVVVCEPVGPGGEKSSSSLTQPVQEKPRDSEELFQQAEALRKSGELEGARYLYDVYLYFFPKGARVREVERGLAMVKPHLAMRSYDPRSEHALSEIDAGDTYMERRNFQNAINHYKHALELQPDNTVALFRLAQAFEANGNLGNARELYSEYLRLRPNGRYTDACRQAMQRLGPAQTAEATPTSAPAETPPSKR